MQDLKAILEELADAEPYNPSKKLYMKWSRKLAHLLLVLGAICMALLVMAGLGYKLQRTPAMAYIALAFYVLTSLFSLLALLVEPAVLVWVMLRWKAETTHTFVSEIENDEASVKRLIRHDEDALKRAQYWVQLKIKRFDTRIVFFFGGSTAVYSLLALTFSTIKDAGGLAWLQHTFLRGFAADNVTNTAILWGIALIFGVSIGAMLMKYVQSRFVYQQELLEMALMRKASARSTP
ncbi:hypothetical protein QCE63_07350 [Caballeronia sp. LZ065]|uniref:hypothetical protein n=1 Tax=Caballeronia sp. LZ065 TaxID=3038571 RepID=UPI00285F1886|nr:hypothetical protein [Caballeronia sp. LZ065]MDR5779245.1 hypothetical protein [Caballeronia sp. LZ065]